MEQGTIQQAQGLIQQYGLVEGILIYVVIMTVLIIAWNVYQNQTVKKFDKKSDKIDDIEQMLTQMKLDHQKDVSRMELMIQERVRYEWAENHLIPKIDSLSQDVSKLTIGIEHQAKTGDILAKSVNHLSSVLEGVLSRVADLEHMPGRNSS